MQKSKLSLIHMCWAELYRLTSLSCRYLLSPGGENVQKKYWSYINVGYSWLCCCWSLVLVSFSFPVRVNFPTSKHSSHSLLSGEHRGGNWPVYWEQLFRLERLLRGGMCRHQYLGAVGGETTKGGDYVEWLMDLNGIVIKGWTLFIKVTPLSQEQFGKGIFIALSCK